MRFSIKAKLAASFGGVLVLLGASGIFGVSSLSRTNAVLTDFAADPFRQVDLAYTLQERVTDARRAMLRLILASTPEDAQKAKADIEADGRGCCRTSAGRASWSRRSRRRAASSRSASSRSTRRWCSSTR